MDGLRRRKQLPSHPQTAQTRPSKRSQSISRCLPLALLCNLTQLILIFFLLSHIRKLSPNIHSLIQPPRFQRNSTAPPHHDFFITIYTYDRPRQLQNLLLDIVREADAAKLSVGVNVIDDNSYGCVFHPSNDNFFDLEHDQIQPFHLVHVDISSNRSIPCSARSRFRDVEQVLKQQQWNLYIAKYHHGRKRYWNLVRMAHILLQSTSADYFIFLPDDDRLASSFFHKVRALWTSISDSRKLTLMLHVEASRETAPTWTDLKPRYIGGDVSRVGYVESGNFICTRDFLSFMNWSFPRVPPQRWLDNPTISSGVGSTMSELIHSSGMRMYRSRQSFVAHVGVSSSRMNPHLRDQNTPGLLTKYFADGNDAYLRLLEEASTFTVSIASQWSREASLHATIYSLSAQVDRINVYLNDYDVIPNYLQAPYITVKRAQSSSEDIGDRGKFFWCNKIATEFHLTADDDIIYPPDYVAKLHAFWRLYKPPVIVGVHGIRIKPELLTPDSGKGWGYYQSREVWMAIESVEKAVNVHILGTGTVLYRPMDVGEIDLDVVFPEANMADIWLGIHAQQLQIPMMVIPHEEGWMKEVAGTFADSIYEKSCKRRSTQHSQTRAAKDASPWRLHAATKVV